MARLIIPLAGASEVLPPGTHVPSPFMCIRPQKSYCASPARTPPFPRSQAPSSFSPHLGCKGQMISIRGPNRCNSLGDVLRAAPAGQADAVTGVLRDSRAYGAQARKLGAMSRLPQFPPQRSGEANTARTSPPRRSWRARSPAWRPRGPRTRSPR